MTAAGFPSSAGLLLIGYGNPLRGDDGVGPTVAERVQALNLSDVRAIACQVLTPELADPISKSAQVVFVDATVDGSSAVRICPLEPCVSSEVRGHTADPQVLLALARDLFGAAPKAWLLTIPVEKLQFSQGISARAAEGVDQAIRMLESCRVLPR